MRCFACNCELTDYEATLRGTISGQFLDMCGECIKESDISAVSFSKTESASSLSKEDIEDY